MRFRVLIDGKPIGFKLCVGSRVDVLAICKAMLEEKVTPDFIVVDGSEGGTGAAPLEYQDNVGTPLTEGLMLVHNALVGVGLRERVRIAAAGKVASGSDIVKRLIQGADFTLSARTMMMATGCIQAQKCHTNECPVGVATQDPVLRKKFAGLPEHVTNYLFMVAEDARQIMADLVARVVEEIFMPLTVGGGIRSRIYQELVVETGVAASAGAYYQGTQLDQSSFSVYGAPRGEATMEAVEEAIDAEIAKIVEEGVTAKELDSAKNRFLRSMIFARDNQSSMANIYGATLATGGTVEDIEEWPDRIRAVTADEVQAVAAKYLDDSVSVTGYLVPARQAED